MFYQYSDELTTIEPQDRDPNLVCAAYITLAELDAHYEKFGFSPSTVQQCKEENRYFRSNIEVYDDYSFGTLKITDAANARAREDCLAFYVKKKSDALHKKMGRFKKQKMSCDSGSQTNRKNIYS